MIQLSSDAPFPSTDGSVVGGPLWQGPLCGGIMAVKGFMSWFCLVSSSVICEATYVDLTS